jgi:hypothetical protein
VSIGDHDFCPWGSQPGTTSAFAARRARRAAVALSTVALSAAALSVAVARASGTRVESGGAVAESESTSRLAASAESFCSAGPTVSVTMAPAIDDGLESPAAPRDCRWRPEANM